MDNLESTAGDTGRNLYYFLLLLFVLFVYVCVSDIRTMLEILKAKTSIVNIAVMYEAQLKNKSFSSNFL